MENRLLIDMGVNKEYIFTSHGITVSAIAKYEEEYSNPELERFIFSYKITIVNNTDLPVQLISRKWEIYDGQGHIRNVEGVGVVGLQPILESNQDFTYDSWCPLSTPLGKMKGFFFMNRLVDNQSLEVKIPEFTLICPFLQN